MIISVYLSQFINGLSACTLTKHYQMLSESGKFLGCPECRVCGFGLEPWPKCGSTIGINTIIEPCRPCANGTYSSEKGTKSCQDCNMKKCFLHQLYKGTCTSKIDTTYCIDKCEPGYKMNSYKTVCVLEAERQNNKTEANQPSADLSSAEIVGIVLGIIILVVVVIIIIVGLCWYKRKMQQANYIGTVLVHSYNY